jgi:hypothetical protein
MLKNQISKNFLMMYLKVLEKQEQAKLKTYGRSEMIMVRAEINEIDTKKQDQ